MRISRVVKDELCTGCGTCIALCPNNTIELIINEKNGIYIPKLNEKECKNCGICYNVCSGHEVDFKALNRDIFGKEPEDPLLGNYLNFYIGHSNEYHIRYNSASGGLVTQLLIFALEEEIIDGALVTKMRKDKPLEPEPFVARTKKEIIDASKSKYCPVPANIAIKEILDSKEGERFAVVGLPCHIHGIRKAEKINKKLREKVVLHLGLLCSINRNFLSQDYLFKKFNVKKEEVIKLDYRGKGWIGGMTIALNDGTEKYSPLPIYWNQILRQYFVPFRCTLCSDQSSELADLSFGDIWLPEFRDDKIGTSLIISRTKTGDKILNEMKFKNKVNLKKIERYKVVESQSYPLKFKKEYLDARITLLKLFRKRTPIYNQKLLKPNIITYLHALLIYSQIFFSSKKYFWWLLEPFGNLLDKISKIKQKIH